MTATTLVFDPPRPAPTVAVCAGRILLLAGAAFATANLVQWSILGGVLALHPAFLGLNWALAVGAFLIGLARLRRMGGEAGRRVAGWSRTFVLIQLGAALSLAGISAWVGDWGLMRWNAVAGLTFYAVGWGIAGLRARSPNMGLLFLTALAGAAVAARLFGTPDQYLAHAVTLALAALVPGLWLAFGRRL